MLLNLVKCAFLLLKWDLFLFVSTFNGKLFDGVEDTNCWTWSLLQNWKERFVFIYPTYNCKKKRKTYEWNHVFKEFGQCSINFFLSWIDASCLQSEKIEKTKFVYTNFKLKKFDSFFFRDDKISFHQLQNFSLEWHLLWIRKLIAVGELTVICTNQVLEFFQFFLNFFIIQQSGEWFNAFLQFENRKKVYLQMLMEYLDKTAS